MYLIKVNILKNLFYFQEKIEKFLGEVDIISFKLMNKKNQR